MELNRLQKVTCLQCQGQNKETMLPWSTLAEVCVLGDSKFLLHCTSVCLQMTTKAPRALILGLQINLNK